MQFGKNLVPNQSSHNLKYTRFTATSANITEEK